MLVKQELSSVVDTNRHPGLLTLETARFIIDSITTLYKIREHKPLYFKYIYRAL